MPDTESSLWTTCVILVLVSLQILFIAFLASKEDGEFQYLLTESLNRVKIITGEDVPFYKVNIMDKTALQDVFRKVSF